MNPMVRSAYGLLCGLAWLAGSPPIPGLYQQSTAPGHLSSNGTRFQRTYGGAGTDQGNYVLQTLEGGYIATGFTGSFGEGIRNLWLLKLGGDGSEQWSRAFGTGGYAGGEALVAADDGFVIIGATLAAKPTNYDVQLLKTDAAGGQLWSRTYGGEGWDWGNFIGQAGDGGFILTGWTDSFGSGGGDLWLIKVGTSGQEEWRRTYGGSAHDTGNCVQATRDGGFIVVGATSSYSVGEDDLWLLKTDGDGNLEWMRVFGGAGFDDGQYVHPTQAGGYIVLGSTTSFGAGDSDIWLINLTEDGRVNWSRTYGGAQWDWGKTVLELPDGGYLVLGSTMSMGAGESDVWLIRTDAAGQEQWSRTFGGPQLDFGLSVQATGDGGFVIAGQTYSYGAGDGDFWLLKTDALGKVMD